MKRATRMIASLRERFDAKWIPEPNSGCWLWEAGMYAAGYGTIGLDDGGVDYAHRVSWELHHGPIPEGAHVLHKCDVRGCVNPAHLFLGDQDSNMKDMARKLRAPRSKLTPAIVQAIRASTEPTRALARLYGVDPAAIRLARRGDTWRHVA